MSREITIKQQEQFNRMRLALIEISRHYMTPDQMRRECDRGYGAGVSYEECIEMSYENIQQAAKNAVHNVKELSFKKPNSAPNAQVSDTTESDSSNSADNQKQ